MDRTGSVKISVLLLSICILRSLIYLIPGKCKLVYQLLQAVSLC